MMTRGEGATGKEGLGRQAEVYLAQSRNRV
jgi:hypothetical protein